MCGLLTCLKVVALAQVERHLVRPVAGDGGPEGLQGRHVLGHQVQVVEEQRGQADGEHSTNEEQEQHVKPGKANVVITDIGLFLLIIFKTDFPPSLPPPEIDDQNMRKY